MKFKLKEEFLTEGKNLQQTFDRYKDKLRKSFDPFEVTDEELWKYMEEILSADPTYQPGGTTTGDYGIWLLNQEVKDNITPFEARTNVSIEQVLNDFVDKKANLANKDINSYKTVEELWNILKEIPLSDRQKERKLRKDISGAKHVGSTANFDIYIPETYEASCALGKGSGWCTADSRTRRYFDYYKNEYGGDYYIIISKDGKWKYQIHFESDQYAAAGTNPDINRPNQEEMMDIQELFGKWPELKEVFSDQIKQKDLLSTISESFQELDFPDIIRFTFTYDDLIDSGQLPDDVVKQWLDPKLITQSQIVKALQNNKEAYERWLNSTLDLQQQYKITKLDSQDINKIIQLAFNHKLEKRLLPLRSQINSKNNNSVIGFTASLFSKTDDINAFDFTVEQYRLAQALLEVDSLHDQVKKYAGNKEQCALIIYDYLKLNNTTLFHQKMLKIFYPEIEDWLDSLPRVENMYFSNDNILTFFFDVYEILLEYYFQKITDPDYNGDTSFLDDIYKKGA